MTCRRRPAKIYSDQRTVTIHLGDSGDGFTLPFKEKWRAPDAAAAVIGFIATGAAVTANLTSGYALRILIIGVVRDRRRRCGCCPSCPRTRPTTGDPGPLVLGQHAAPDACSHRIAAAEMHSLAPQLVVGNLRLTGGRRLRRLPAVGAAVHLPVARSGRTPSPPTTPSCGEPCRRARRSAG